MWEDLREAIGKPLSTLPIASEEIGESLYRVGPGYVFLTDLFPDLTRRDEPVISLVFWAASPGAMLRAIERKIEADDGAVAIPPPSMLLAPGAARYAEIVQALKTDGVSFIESASYRIATDGAFIHKTIESRTYRCFFRSRHERPDEVPYVIARAA